MLFDNTPPAPAITFMLIDPYIATVYIKINFKTMNPKLVSV